MFDYEVFILNKGYISMYPVNSFFTLISDLLQLPADYFEFHCNEPGFCNFIPRLDTSDKQEIAVGLS